MQKWITHEYMPTSGDSFYKPRADVTYIAERMGYKVIGFDRDISWNLNEAETKAELQGITAGVSEGDIVVYSCYPSFNVWWFEWEFIKKLKAKGAKVALMIMDLKLLWGWDCPFPEISFLNEADIIIAQSEPMKDYLQSNGLTAKVIIREAHDIVLNEADAPLSDRLERKLSFVGAAIKSPFLRDWNYETELWASYNKASWFEVSPKVINGGVHSFEELIRVIPKESFGILWDSDLEPEPKMPKAFREYTRYTAPHKVGLYLALGLPLIVWDESAAALLVKKYGLGYAVSSLDDIDPLMARLTDEELHDLKQRVNHFSRAIRNGFFTRRALIETEEALLLG